MIFIFFYLFIIIYIFLVISGKLQSTSNTNILNTCFNNVQKISSSSNMSLYKGDKSGENFLIGIINNFNTVSLINLTELYETSERNHIHNKILVTDYKIIDSSTLYKKAKEYEIQIWNSTKLKSLTNSSNDLSQTEVSPLQTSDTSDDTCEIEEDSFDPIQSGFNSHSIFSIFTDKPNHL